MNFDKTAYREKFQWIRENCTLKMMEITNSMGVSAFLLRRFLLTDDKLRTDSIVKIRQWIDKKEKAIKEQQ